jgi:hypothetical protein
LIFISLMISSVIFRHLLAIPISLEKLLFKYFAYFWIGLLASLSLSFRSSLYVVDFNSLSAM